MYKNIGMQRVKNLNINNFTSNAGIKIRKTINPVVRIILNLAASRKMIIESQPKLEKNVPYIFASTHLFTDDIVAALVAIDRNAYALLGMSDQIEHNPKIYMAWINGMIYVNRMDPQSRKDSVEKMVKLLNKGTSILIFPEGGLNNSENQMCMPLFAGPWTLAQRTGCKVVPISSFNEFGSKKAYIKVGEPMDLANMDKKEALTLLRETLGTMRFSHIEKYATRLNRSDLGDDCYLKFFEDRKTEYLKEKWTRDVWDEELVEYIDKENSSPREIRTSLGKIVLTKENLPILYPHIVEAAEDEERDFKKYMKKNWKKK